MSAQKYDPAWVSTTGEQELDYAREQEMTFEEYQQEMIRYAKEVQGENYVGDDYYLQAGCWEEHWQDGDTAEEAVDSDMSYWEP